MDDEPDRGTIRPRLSTFDTAMVVFSLVVGIGIFRTPAMVAGAAGGTALFFTAWIAAGLISLIGALTFAEIGSRYPRAGGYYRVVADCYRPTLAFMLNWSQTLMQGAGAAGVAFIGAEYLMPVILPPQWRTPHASLGAGLRHHADPAGVQLPRREAGRARAESPVSAQDRHDPRARRVCPAARAAAGHARACIRRAHGAAPGIGVDSLLLRLRRIPIDHEPGSRFEGRAAALPARHHGRHVQRGRVFICCSISPISGCSGPAASRTRSWWRPHCRARPSDPPAKC